MCPLSTHLYTVSVCWSVRRSATSSLPLVNSTRKQGITHPRHHITLTPQKKEWKKEKVRENVARDVKQRNLKRKNLMKEESKRKNERKSRNNMSMIVAEVLWRACKCGGNGGHVQCIVLFCLKWFRVQLASLRDDDSGGGAGVAR